MRVDARAGCPLRRPHRDALSDLGEAGASGPPSLGCASVIALAELRRVPGHEHANIGISCSRGSEHRLKDPEAEPKPLRWVGTSKAELIACPDEVKRRVGRALWDAQTGLKAPFAKPLKGLGGAGNLEVVDDYDGDTCRAVYTVRFAGAVYVLHAFQKKSKRGISTPTSGSRNLVKNSRRLSSRASSGRSSSSGGSPRPQPRLRWAWTSPRCPRC